MILDLKLFPDPILTSPTERVEEITQEIKQLAQDMIETMAESKGVGLSANQVGKSLRMFVCDLAPFSRKVQPLVVINPKIIKKSDGMSVSEEGCLSAPGKKLMIKRYDKVQVACLTIDGEQQVWTAHGTLARIFQHEIDHLNGIAFAERSER